MGVAATSSGLGSRHLGIEGGYGGLSDGRGRFSGFRRDFL